MSNYVKATNFAVKDTLSTGNPSKIVKGTEIDTEYNAISSAISSKADTNSPTFTGTPAGPTASAGTNTTQLATTAFVTTAVAAAVAAAVPSGMIMIWSGSIGSIPTGWVLCNGSSGTPDLRDKFVVGAGSTYTVADTGGSANAIAVSHTHTATTASDGAHVHSVVGTKSDGYTIYGADKFYTVSSGGPAQYVDSLKTTGILSAGAHTHSITVASTGSSGTNANLPPYYALCYIMKT